MHADSVFPACNAVVGQFGTPPVGVHAGWHRPSPNMFGRLVGIISNPGRGSVCSKLGGKPRPSGWAWQTQRDDRSFQRPLPRPSFRQGVPPKQRISSNGPTTRNLCHWLCQRIEWGCTISSMEIPPQPCEAADSRRGAFPTASPITVKSKERRASTGRSCPSCATRPRESRLLEAAAAADGTAAVRQ